MSNLLTSKGNISFKNKIPPTKSLSEKETTENLSTIQVFLDRAGIGWGPAFGTLIGIIRNDGFLPWANDTSFYVLKEDEERFKDALWSLFNQGFNLVRFERRGLFCIERNNQWHSFYIMRKISPEIRHSGGKHFVFDRYLQETTRWDFRGIKLNVPSDLDEYLTFQYGDWMNPLLDSKSFLKSFFENVKLFVKDRIPNSVYYPLILRHHRKDFNEFKERCIENGITLSSNIELSYLKPRKNKRVLTVGVYDLIHKGHVELFRRARGLGDHLIVAVQSSDFILKYKPQSQILNSTEDRIYMVQSIKWVDEVCVYEDVDEFVKSVDFDLFVSGPDQIHSGFKRAIKWCEENGKEFMILGRTEGVSSSELKEKISKKKNAKL